MLKNLLPLLIAGALPIAAQAQSSPRKTVEELLTGALSAVKLPKAHILKGTDGQRGFCDLVDGGFDAEGIARALVPAGVWDAGSPDQQHDYVRAVVGHLANFAAFSFLQTGGKPLTPDYKEKPAKDGLSVVEVRAREYPTDASVAYLKANADSSYRIYDLNFGGVSLLVTKRGDFRSTAAKGLPALTQALNNMSRTRMLGDICPQRRVPTQALDALASGAQLKHEIEILDRPGLPAAAGAGRSL